jgi:predicted small lipoprotein YifL
MRRAWPLLALAALAADGCGQKGPLYLPDKGGKVVTSAPAATPAPPARDPAAATPEAAPPESAAPAAPAPPKPADKDKTQDQDPQPPK